MKCYGLSVVTFFPSTYREKRNMPPKNNLPTWGNESSMNLNSLILTNIQSSPYFKNELIKLKTYHEVIDEIYYRVSYAMLPILSGHPGERFNFKAVIFLLFWFLS